MIHKSDSQAIMICSLLSREIENRIDVIQAISTSTSLEILKNGLADCALSFQPEEDCHSTLVFGVKQTHAVPRPELHLTVLKLSSQLSAAIARKPSSSRAA